MGPIFDLTGKNGESALNKKLLMPTLEILFSRPSVIINIKKIRNANLTYLSYGKLINISRYIGYIVKNNISGDFIEAGCALGGSAILIATQKDKNRNFEIYDTFTQIPEPSQRDYSDAISRYDEIVKGKASGISDDLYYGYEENLLEKVKQNFNRFGLDPQEENIHFHKGLFKDTLRINQPVAFAHLDSDWYDSVYFSLEQIVPYLVKDGILIIDDYYDWKGAKKAVDDFFVEKDGFVFIEGPQLVIRKS